MTNVGFLVIERDYFVPFVNWAIACHKEGKFNIVGFHCNKWDIFAEQCPGFNDFKRLSFEETAESSDLVFSFGYWKKISAEDIAKVKLGIVNLHHSYCLRYKGRHTCTWAIQNGESLHGSTLHYIDEQIDVGQIIDSLSCRITNDDTAFTLLQKVNTLAFKMLAENIDRILAGNAASNILLDPNPFSYRAVQMCHEIDTELLNQPVILDRMIRSLTFPGSPRPFVMLNGHKVELVLTNES